MDTPVGPLGGPGLEIPPDQSADQAALQQEFNKVLGNEAFQMLSSAISDAVNALNSDD